MDDYTKAIADVFGLDKGNIPYCVGFSSVFNGKKCPYDGWYLFADPAKIAKEMGHVDGNVAMEKIGNIFIRTNRDGNRR